MSDTRREPNGCRLLLQSGGYLLLESGGQIIPTHPVGERTVSYLAGGKYKRWIYPR